jgi:hypothetical protein
MLALLCVGVGARVFERYESSAWELEWLANIDSAWLDNECAIMAQPKHYARALWSVYSTQRRMQLPALNARPSTVFADADIYSRLHYRCNGKSMFELIEPLVGLLRDPLSICKNVPRPKPDVFQRGESSVQSKRWLLLQPWSGGGGGADSSCQTLPRGARRLLFDFGASTYAGWGSDGAAAGARWFVERYEVGDMHFDAIFSFEAVVQKPKSIYAGVPAALLPHYYYYNVGVERNRTSIFNPLTFIAAVAHAVDHVTVKLDIDSPGIENDVMAQLSQSPATQTLIDEMFFEHHVESTAMRPYWKTNVQPGARLNNTYQLMLSLRRRGLRMHSWP